MRSINFDLVRQNPRPRVVAKGAKAEVTEIAPTSAPPPPAPVLPKPPVTK